MTDGPRNGSYNGLDFGPGGNAVEGEHKTNERDEQGRPVGVSTFEGAASENNGLPTDEETN